MTRPLLDRTVVELAAMADRNRTNRAELDLIRAELRHRSTPKAQDLAKTIARHLKDLEQTAAASSVPTLSVLDRLDALSRLVSKDWNSPAALERYLQRTSAFSGNSAAVHRLVCRSCARSVAAALVSGGAAWSVR